MPQKPTREVLEAGKKTLNPKDVLEAVINDMHDSELEDKLVAAGVAVKVEE